MLHTFLPTAAPGNAPGTEWTRGSFSRSPDSSRPAGSNTVPLRALFWFLAILLGLLQVGAHRYEVAPDGISYIEMAQAGGTNFINGYWSPLYPFLLRLVFQIVHPSLVWESTVVHFTNLVIFLLNLAAFEVFLKELIRLRAARFPSDNAFQARPTALLSARSLWVAGYILFLWAGHFWVTSVWVTPDLCVAGLCYLATAALLRIDRNAAGWLTFASLGAVLGLAYWAKAPMFLIALVFLAAAAWLGRTAKAIQFSVTLLLFLALAAPLVFALSRAKGRLTFGDSGKINYAEFVNGAPKYVHWQGEPPGTGIPAHPTHKILSAPALYEFSTPIGGSYPPWYDPSYWYEGIEPHFSLRGQRLALSRTSSSYLRILSITGTLYVILLPLLVFWARGQVKFARRGTAPKAWPVWMPAWAALLLYALVHVEARFVGGFLLMLLMGSLARLRWSPSANAVKLAYLMALAPAMAIAWSAGQNIRALASSKPFEQWAVARGLQQMGVAPGDSVGCLGTGLEAYWAHLAQLRIVAEVSDFGAFVNASGEQRSEVLPTFGKLGVKAVLTKQPDIAHSPEGWQHIAGSRYFVWWPTASPSTLRKPRAR